MKKNGADEKKGVLPSDFKTKRSPRRIIVSLFEKDLHRSEGPEKNSLSNTNYIRDG